MKTFALIGNRAFVLQSMLEKKLPISEIFAFKNSYLERFVIAEKIPHQTFSNLNELEALLTTLSADCVVLNGCPIIIEKSFLRQRQFINIHPSYLPDLRGKDPQVGAILLQRDSGASCHIVTETLDSGPIISQVKIPYSEDLDAELLYQLSFIAEKEVFCTALERGFSIEKREETTEQHLYFTRNELHNQIKFSQSGQQIFSQIKALSNPNQGARFRMSNIDYSIFDVEKVCNPFLMDRFKFSQPNTVIMMFSDSVLLYKQPFCLRLKKISPFPQFKVGQVLCNEVVE